MAPGTPTGSIVRDGAAVLAEAREMVEPAHRMVLDGLPAPIRHVAGYHRGWWDADGRPSGKTGKTVRPALVLASSQAAGGEPDVGVPAAVAVELVHDFSLLHDDVMDGDLTRRHRPAAWTVFGIGQAILAGDALLAAAMELLNAGEPIRVLVRTLLELCEGQSADLAFEGRGEVGLAECLRMAELKTGALLGAACQLGALAAGAPPETAWCFRGFGRHLGTAFQLVDDLLGIWGAPEVTGKPAGSDLTSRKKSLPVVAALTSDTREGEQLARLYGRAEDLDETRIVHAAHLVEAAGGRAWADG